MKKVKLLLAVFLIALGSNLALAETGFKNVVVKEARKHRVNVKTELDANETMLVSITNEDGDVILSDLVSDSPRLVSKTYDFNEARYGNYELKIFINDELVESTVISEKDVTFQKAFKVEVY